MARELIDEMVNLRIWAVVGASNNREKFGRRIFDDMKSAGYEVYAVNPREERLDDGTPCYPSVRDLPVVPDVVDVVVPPPLGVSIVEDCATKGVTRIWFQPGASSPEAVRLAEERGLKVLHDGPCAMVEKRRW